MLILFLSNKLQLLSTKLYILFYFPVCGSVLLTAGKSETWTEDIAAGMCGVIPKIYQPFTKNPLNTIPRKESNAILSLRPFFFSIFR